MAEPAAQAEPEAGAEPEQAGTTLKDDLTAMTADDTAPIDPGLLVALVALVNDAESSSADMLAYILEFMLERLYFDSMNVQGKTLVMLQLLCDKSPPFVEMAKGHQDVIDRIAELSASEAATPDDQSAVAMLVDTSRQVLMMLGEVMEVEEAPAGGGWAITRVARRARRNVVGGVSMVGRGVGGTVVGGVTMVGKGVGGTVVGGVTMVGKGVTDAAGGVKDAAGGAIDKTPLNRLTRSKTVPDDGVTKEQRQGAIRLFDIMMKHGRKQMETARALAEDGHQVMANVMVTMELLSIQKEAAGERFEFLDDERFEQVSALFNELSEIEEALRHHNSMKMAIYGILNKQRHGSSTLEFNLYVFVLEETLVRYYTMGETTEEDSFGINFVYKFDEKSFLKKSALERIATLGMGSSTLDGDDSEDKKYSFKISLLKSKSGVKKTKDELLMDDLESRKRSAVAAENWGAAESLTKEIHELEAKMKAKTDAQAEPEAEAEAEPEPEPEAEPEAEPEPEPEASSKPMSRMEKARAMKARAKAAAKEAGKKAEAAADIAKGKAAAGAAAAQEKASYAASEARAIAQGAADAKADFEGVDMTDELDGQIMNGVGQLSDLKVDSVIAAAPDQVSMDMWRSALTQLKKQQMKYRKRYVPEPPSRSPSRSRSPDASTDDAADAAESAETVLTDWLDCFVVLYKTSVMIFNREGGMELESIPLWRVFPASVGACADEEIGGSKVFTVKTTASLYYFDTQVLRQALMLLHVCLIVWRALLSYSGTTGSGRGPRQPTRRRSVTRVLYLT